MLFGQNADFIIRVSSFYTKYMFLIEHTRFLVPCKASRDDARPSDLAERRIRENNNYFNRSHKFRIPRMFVDREYKTTGNLYVHYVNFTSPYWRTISIPRPCRHVRQSCKSTRVRVDVFARVQKEIQQMRDCSQPWHRTSRSINYFVNYLPGILIKMTLKIPPPLETSYSRCSD